MKIILSRKGFDSSSGGCPNPILPSGRLLPLPIPDTASPVTYSELNPLIDIDTPSSGSSKIDIGQLVEDLTGKRILRKDGAHLDPDVVANTYKRKPRWRPLFGQSGAAQGHLTKQGVTDGDLFLFFGLFQLVEQSPAGRWQFVKGAPKQHVLWGWLQADKKVEVASVKTNALNWARYHPHFYGTHSGANCLYLAREQLRMGRSLSRFPGAGAFSSINPKLILTAPQSEKPSLWLLPNWLYPKPNQQPLSYHHKPWRWQQREEGAYLQAVARGQEFVLDTRYYPNAVSWALSLITAGFDRNG